jgi:hypothetical protein
MGDFVSLTDLANSLDIAVNIARGNSLIEQAEGLVVEKIGDHAPWTPAAAYSTPRTVAIRAAGRPLRNPKGVTTKAVDAVSDSYPDERLGVYLDAQDTAELAQWLAELGGSLASGSPVGSFPDPLEYPDPARGPHWPTATIGPLTDWE